MTVESASRTDVGLRRKVNEDAFLDRRERGLFAVADGMGGHEAGDLASAKIITALDQLETAAEVTETADRAALALDQVNGELISMAAAATGSGTIGSTVVGLAITAGRFCCFWAGDSRAYLLRQGQLRQLSRDHSFVQQLVDAGILSLSDAAAHPQANVITRAVGVAPNLLLDRTEGDALEGDCFLLASDGLTRVVADQDILDVLEAHDIQRAADRLIAMVLERGAPDNVTLVIVRLN